MRIDIPLVERFCANSCFVLLFCTTVYYWSKNIFTDQVSYSKKGLIGVGSTLCCLTAHLIFRWFDSGHFPLSNLYESLLFLAWCLLILHIYIETTTKTLFLGVLTSPALLCLMAFTDFSLPPELQRGGPLVPALQSNWLIMHVTVMIASYAALLLGCLVSIAYLIFSQFFENQIPTKFEKLSQELLILENQGTIQPLNSSNSNEPAKTFNFSTANPLTVDVDQNINVSQITEPSLRSKKLSSFFPNSTKLGKFLKFLDNLSYRTIGIGFCFLTLGILSGAVWANETWGNYWSWDPKETWAFITWLTFASYLHSRLIGGWTGSKPAWIASFGFVIVWVCYLGVNLLGQGLHSYGFLQI
uniref:Cytochrome c biogenesis protein CcsA n=1 Tax=Auxenochlorella pyrenoidosa TaxID=3078 RepID=A0A5P8P4E7_AUXPY|nr:cytochrome c biogenesis protein [Auxenochlorella pyrenoidosa]